VKTRDKILKVSRALFNEQGLPNVTVAQIAQKAKISEGNLWYHFRTKLDILLALFEELEKRMDENLSRKTDKGSGIDQFVDYTVQSFKDIWEYRFFYRDKLDPLLRDSRMWNRSHALTERGHARVAKILKQMVAEGLLNAAPGEISELAANAWIVSTYWLEYAQTRYRIATITEQHMRSGYRQVFSLYKPYLTDKAKQQMRKREEKRAVAKRTAKSAS
jgi:AcrR family transcriptional regulator